MRTIANRWESAIGGVEGGVVPPLIFQARVVSYRPGGIDEAWKLDPRETGIESAVRAAPRVSTPDQTAADESLPRTVRALTRRAIAA